MQAAAYLLELLCLNRPGFDAASFCEKDAVMSSITRSSSVSVR